MSDTGKRQPREMSIMRIRLGVDRPAPQPDPLGRNRIGWAEGLDLQGLWDRGRGVWDVDLAAIAEADLVVLVADDLVRLVGAVDGVTFHGDRVAIEGRPLLGHPLVGGLDPFPNNGDDPIAGGTVTALPADAFPAGSPGYSELLADAIGVLTTAVRRRRPVVRQDDRGRLVADPERAEPGDWAQFVTVALAAAAANNGGIVAVLTASPPESEEATGLRQLLHTIVSYDESKLWAYRTEPVEIRLCVNELLMRVASDAATAYDAADDEVRRRFEDGIAATDQRSQLEALRVAELREWGDTLRARILQLAAELPELAVPVRVEIDTTTHRSDRNADEYSLEERLISRALDATPTPADLPGTPLERLDWANGRSWAKESVRLI